MYGISEPGNQNQKQIVRKCEYRQHSYWKTTETNVKYICRSGQAEGSSNSIWHFTPTSLWIWMPPSGRCSGALRPTNNLFSLPWTPDWFWTLDLFYLHILLPNNVGVCAYLIILLFFVQICNLFTFLQATREPRSILVIWWKNLEMIFDPYIPAGFRSCYLAKKYVDNNVKCVFRHEKCM